MLTSPSAQHSFARASLLTLLALLATGIANLPDAAADTTPDDANSTIEVPSSRQRAEEYAREALDAYEHGEFVRALELLHLAYSHHRDLVFRYNLILTNAALGDHDEVLRLLEAHGDALRVDRRFRERSPSADELERAARDALHGPPLDPDTSVDASPRRLPALSLLSAGGLSLVASGLFGSGILIRDTIERIESSRSLPNLSEVYSDPSYTRDQDLSTLRTHQILTLSTGIAGLAMTTTGVVLLLRSPPHNHSLLAQPPHPRISPVLTTTFQGAQLRWQF